MLLRLSQSSRLLREISVSIVWGDRVCTATATPETAERMLVCLDRTTGAILWRQTVVKGPLEKIHKENSYASGTPATDGQRVYVAFQGGAFEISDGSDPLEPWCERPRGTWDAWRNAGADGVIFILLKFCDPHAFDYPYIKALLDSAGIPRRARSWWLPLTTQPTI